MTLSVQYVPSSFKIQNVVILATNCSARSAMINGEVGVEVVHYANKTAKRTYYRVCKEDA